jgi:hypothetical protein
MGWWDGFCISIIAVFSLYKLHSFSSFIMDRFMAVEIENKKLAGILDSELYASTSPEAARGRKTSTKFNPDEYIDKQNNMVCKMCAKMCATLSWCSGGAWSFLVLIGDCSH